MNKRKRRFKRSLEFFGAILVTVSFVFLIGTTQGWGASSTSAPEFSSGDAGKTETLPIGYGSNRLGRPDPFVPFVEKDLAQKKLKAMKKVRPLSIFPLQRAGVNEFRLVGIAGSEQGRTAVVTNARGNYFPLTVGTVIGLNGGTVTDILEDSVIVEERAVTGKGQYKTRRIPLKLQKAN
ncbi:type IV pilus assembly protein PilP [Syntrophus gentianae]|uniref:Type IV pilus assembly protein PilP n=1 Tax=Syntrophus gentianae TaxID=43775 RepID=A0A1H7UEC4_9BACT|nr:pilus assembly protein PilP [Syntrophus gentianae]SEL95412.1 type IV pilus assembly protein PilP [Syntrophus gentianae]